MMNGNGEGSSHARNAAPSASLQPQVVVLSTDFREELGQQEPEPNLHEDLWLSTADGRYCTQPVPVRVGGLHNMQTFHVHRDVLTKSAWFRKALLGKFMEAQAQAIDLPEEDPAIFHFIIAFLYEGRFTPIRAAASVLDPVVDKGKGREAPDAADAENSDSSSSSSGSGNRSRSGSGSNHSSSTDSSIRRRRIGREKHPGQHRPGCTCWRCFRPTRPLCVRCTRQTHMAPPPPLYNRPVPSTVLNAGMAGLTVHVPDPRAVAFPGVRLKNEDMRTWLMAYELSLDVYICACRYLLDDLCTAVMRHCIDMLESAGTDAAVPEVLRLCAKLHAGVPQNDSFLAMVLARVGFLQPIFWKKAPVETGDFLTSNPEVATSMLREMALRRAMATGAETLPPMEGYHATT